QARAMLLPIATRRCPDPMNCAMPTIFRARRQLQAFKSRARPLNMAQTHPESSPLSVLRIAIAQLNPTVGDISGNLELARKARREAAGQGADLVLFTELFISGYPPEDLVLKP